MTTDKKFFGNPVRVVLLLLALLIIGLLLTMCGFTGEALDGQVVEEGTNGPIPGAIVVARWDGTVTALVDSRTACVYVESAVTDDQGRFHFPRWYRAPRFLVFGVLPTVTAYKAGYEARPYEEKVHHLKPFTGTREERIKYLLRLTGLIGCYSAAEEKTLVPVYKALYDEARGIATTDKDKGVLQTIRRDALYAWSRPSRELTTREVDQAIQNDPYLRVHFP
ncbi:MAG: hypothetical protein ACM3JD_07330 [Rudaea sp.]